MYKIYSINIIYIMYMIHILSYMYIHKCIYIYFFFESIYIYIYIYMGNVISPLHFLASHNKSHIHQFTISPFLSPIWSGQFTISPFLSPIWSGQFCKTLHPYVHVHFGIRWTVLETLFCFKALSSVFSSTAEDLKFLQALLSERKLSWSLQRSGELWFSG